MPVLRLEQETSDVPNKDSGAQAQQPVLYQTLQRTLLCDSDDRSNLRLPALNPFLPFSVCAISIIKGFLKSLWAFLLLSCLFLTSLVFNCYLTIVLIFSWSQKEKPGSRCDGDSLPLSPAAARERKRSSNDARAACTPLTPEQRGPRGGPRAAPAPGAARTSGRPSRRLQTARSAPGGSRGSQPRRHGHPTVLQGHCSSQAWVPLTFSVLPFRGSLESRPGTE